MRETPFDDYVKQRIKAHEEAKRAYEDQQTLLRQMQYTDEEIREIFKESSTPERRKAFGLSPNNFARMILDARAEIKNLKEILARHSALCQCPKCMPDGCL